jgi:hypothetical protein
VSKPGKMGRRSKLRVWGGVGTRAGRLVWQSGASRGNEQVSGGWHVACLQSCIEETVMVVEMAGGGEL